MIKPFQIEDCQRVKDFTDEWIGKNYYSLEELCEIVEFSTYKGQNASLLAFENDELAGVRLTFAPGLWLNKARGITQSEWGVCSEKVAYFKSLFIAEKFQQKGIGRKLSSASIEILKEMGAKAIICHSWLESPGNSSQIYLKKMGFEAVAEHPEYWKEIDYLCTRCAPSRCLCTASEMIKYL